MARGVDGQIKFHFADAPVEASATVLPWDGDVSNIRIDEIADSYEAEGPTVAAVDHASGMIASRATFQVLAHDWMRKHFWDRKNGRCGWWFIEGGIASGTPTIYLPSYTTINVRVRGKFTFYEVIAELHGDPAWPTVA